MDWYLAGDRPEDLPLVRRELLSYLARHGAPSSDFVGTELVIAEALGNALQHSGGPVWVSLMWSASQPVLSVYDLGPGFDAELDIGEESAVDLLMAMGAEPPTIQQVDLETAPMLTLGTSDLELLPESGRGVLLMQALAQSLQARKRTGEGMILTLDLPVTRRPTVSHDPPRRRHGVLPSM